VFFQTRRINFYHAYTKKNSRAGNFVIAEFVLYQANRIWQEWQEWL